MHNFCFFICDAHCSALSIRIRDIRRMEKHIILSLIAHIIIRFNCQCMHNIAAALKSGLSTMLAIYLHQKLIIHIENENASFFWRHEKQIENNRLRASLT